MKLTPEEIEEIKAENAAYTEAWERGYREGFECGFHEAANRSPQDFELNEIFDALY